MNLPLVSVHIITYNQKNFIAEALDSVVAQDYGNIEIVVADDGSTDGAADVILDYAMRYPGKIIPLVGGPNLGITGNSNRALSSCRGKYIAFMGGDDVFLPGKISKQVEWFEEKSSRVLCGHQVEVFYEDGSPPHNLTRTLRRGTGPKDYIHHGTLFGAVSVMVRTDSIPKHGFDSQLPTVSDGMFFNETLMGGGEFGHIEGVYARYRKHDNNVTNQWQRCVDDLSKYFEIIRQRYPDYKRDADIGEANIVIYGYGLKFMNEGDLKQAASFFWQGIKTNPLGFKLWARFAQTLYKGISFR
tara:strand:- start:1102 stop:2001 length:900 start_codon:yes stop_codon:yes gene_type:complete